MCIRSITAVILALGLSSGVSAQSDAYVARNTALTEGFARVAAGTAKPADWGLLCGLVAGDGAWHLDVESTAFEAFQKNPSAYFDRYRAGDDCALVLLFQALEWPREALDVELGCGAEDRATVARYTSHLSAIAGSLPHSGAKDRVLSEVTFQALAAFECAALAHAQQCATP